MLFTHLRISTTVNMLSQIRLSVRKKLREKRYRGSRYNTTHRESCFSDSDGMCMRATSTSSVPSRWHNSRCPVLTTVCVTRHQPTRASSRHRVIMRSVSVRSHDLCAHYLIRHVSHHFYTRIEEFMSSVDFLCTLRT
jgi:hypothetical protein